MFLSELASKNHKILLLWMFFFLNISILSELLCHVVAGNVIENPSFRGYSEKTFAGSPERICAWWCRSKDPNMFDIGNRAKPMNTFEIVIGLIIKRSR